jgi:hypothetical protein
MEQLEEMVVKGELDRVLLTLVQALEGYPELRVSRLAANRIRQGGTLNSSHLLDPDRSGIWPDGPHKVLDPDNNLVAMVAKSAAAETDGEDKQITFKTLRVFGPVL